MSPTPALSLELPSLEDRNVHGDWFDTLEKMGESFLFRLGRYRRGMPEPEWFLLPHQHFDGLGGLAHLLRTTQRMELTIPELAAVERPSSRAKWMAALRLLGRRPVRPRPWRAPQSEPTSSPDAAFAWTLFSEADTLALRAEARSRDVSLNGWLLWALAESCLERLAPGREGAAWIVPINMRGAVSGARDTANLASILDVAFPLPAQPSDVDAALRRERSRLAHFGAWQLLQLVGHLPKGMRRTIVRHEARVAKHGSFSNLGQLELRNQTASDVPEWWMAFNPVIRSRPVGMACLTWQGRMAVTLQLHPVLKHSEREACDWLSTWRKLVLPSSAGDHGTGHDNVPYDDEGAA
jgi:hypothetical protein